MRKFVLTVHAQKKKRISAVFVVSIPQMSILLAINVIKNVRINEKK